MDREIDEGYGSMFGKIIKRYDYGADLFAVVAGKTGFVEFQHDNTKDLRMWRLEPQSVRYQVLSEAIEEAKNEGGYGIFKRIVLGLEAKGVTLVNVGW